MLFGLGLTLNHSKGCTMHHLKLGTACLVLLLTLTLIGCGGPRLRNEVQSTTKGQELLDLNQAREQGLITEKEYNQQKKKILKR
jgi:hypothetical protein